jgi:2-C-methyl-D-erythritol 2,4-cyclodiphosphate synthase
MLIGPNTLRTGIGYDVHRFAEPSADGSEANASSIRLGGVDVPYHRQLLAHSDGDVLLHAIMDALLGAAGLGDIGERFPDTDPAYKGADSLGLLRETAHMIKEKGYGVLNIDATLIGQEPKIAPYKKEMAAKVAAAVGIQPEQVNIKGTTTEKLGFAGRKEGLAAEAICLLLKETD